MVSRDRSTCLLANMHENIANASKFRRNCKGEKSNGFQLERSEIRSDERAVSTLLRACCHHAALDSALDSKWSLRGNAVRLIRIGIAATVIFALVGIGSRDAYTKTGSCSPQLPFRAALIPIQRLHRKNKQEQQFKREFTVKFYRFAV